MSLSEKYRIKCPFCSIQDDLILKRGNPNSALFDKENIFELYYDDKNDRGLCPRGNFSVELVNSPYRLRNVLLDGKPLEMHEALKECSSNLKLLAEKNNSTAILFSGNHTLEEAYLASELAKSLNTELLGIFPFEDEALLSVKNDFAFDDLSSSDLILSVGDVFSHSPTLAKCIIDARNKERGNRLLYMDIISGRMGAFAETYNPKPGFLAYFLEFLLDYLKGKKKKLNLEKTGIGLPSSTITEIADSLKSSKDGSIIFSNVFGHFRNPYTIVDLLGDIAHETDTHFSVIPVGQNSIGVGRVIGDYNNGRIIEALLNDELQALITFGGLPAEIIPGFESYARNLDMIISSSFFKKVDGNWGYIFPSAFSFEKEGSLISLEEEVVTLGKNIPPVGGVISDGVLISDLIKSITGIEVKAEVSKAVPLERRGKINIDTAEVDDEFPYHLVCIGFPYHHAGGGITRKMEWNIERGGPFTYLNPSQYIEYKPGDEIKVETPYSSETFRIGDIKDIPFEIPEGILVIPTHYPESRRLFPFKADIDGIYSPGVTKARLEK